MRRAGVHHAVRWAHAGRAAGYAREDALGGIDFAQARFYDSVIGRFLSPDTIVPNPADPQSLNRFSYTLNNPLRYTDPTGHIGVAEASEADKIAAELESRLNITINKDWGRIGNQWNIGVWQLRELRLLLAAANDLSKALNGDSAFNKMLDGSRVEVMRVSEPIAGLARKNGRIQLGDALFNQSGESDLKAKIAIVHEFAHIWDFRSSSGRSALGLDGIVAKGLTGYIGTEKGPTGYAQTNRQEDWAESVVAYVYPDYLNMLSDPARRLANGIDYAYEISRRGAPPQLEQKHRDYVALQIAALQP